MKNRNRLFSIMLICCLCPALISAMAETVSPEVDPAAVGVWFGNIGGDWGQMNMKADGTWESLVYSNNNLSSSGTYRNKDGLGSATDVKFGDSTTAYTIEGDTMHWLIGGAVREFHRMAEPLIRVPLPETAAAASADAAIAGTWKGTENGVYSEWTFMSDGSYERITPADDKTVAGIYVASGGMLVIILESEVLKGHYISHDGGYIELIIGGSSVYLKKEYGGRLVPMSQAEAASTGK
jgi:hypothetical protein